MLCTECKLLKIIEVSLKADGTAKTRQGICKKYNCTLQPTQKTFSPNKICIVENGFESIGGIE